MAFYKLSRSVRIVPYYANHLGGAAEPTEDGKAPESHELKLEDGQPKVFNMPVGGLKTLVYTEASDASSINDELREEYDRVVYSPFPSHFKGLEKRELPTEDGSYKAVEEVDLNKQQEKRAAKRRGAEKKENTGSTQQPANPSQ